MKWNELKRIAIKKGWKLLREGANHEIYVHPDRPTERLTIGRHGKEEIKPGLYKSLKKQIGF